MEVGVGEDGEDVDVGWRSVGWQASISDESYDESPDETRWNAQKQVSSSRSDQVPRVESETRRDDPDLKAKSKIVSDRIREIEGKGHSLRTSQRPRQSSEQRSIRQCAAREKEVSTGRTRPSGRLWAHLAGLDEHHDAADEQPNLESGEAINGSSVPALGPSRTVAEREKEAGEEEADVDVLADHIPDVDSFETERVVFDRRGEDDEEDVEVGLYKEVVI